MPNKPITVWINAELVEWLDREAKRQMRSRNKQLEYILSQCAFFGGYVVDKKGGKDEND